MSVKHIYMYIQHIFVYMVYVLESCKKIITCSSTCSCYLDVPLNGDNIYAKVVSNIL